MAGPSVTKLIRRLPESSNGWSQLRCICHVGTIYVDQEGDNIADVRFCLARFGEDVNLVLARFWDEVRSSGFTVVPVFSHGLPPRRALSTRRSIAAALETITLEPGSQMEMRWKEVACDLGVAWPRRLQAA